MEEFDHKFSEEKQLARRKATKTLRRTLRYPNNNEDDSTWNTTSAS